MNGIFSNISWKSGAIASADGVPVANNKRLYTEFYLPLATAYITPLSGYRFNLAVYDYSGEYQGMWSGTQPVKNTATWFNTQLDLTQVGNYYFRITMARDPDGSNMSTDLGSNIVLSTTFDKMLYFQNVLLNKVLPLTVYDGTVV